MDEHDIVARIKEIHVELGDIPSKMDLVRGGITEHQLNKVGGTRSALKMAGLTSKKAEYIESVESRPPKILTLDIELKPIVAYVWQVWGEFNISPDQILEDWSVISWSAKWIDGDEVIYRDLRDKKDLMDDKEILEDLWKLLDEADIIITQNGKKFDEKKINARFFKHNMRPPSCYRHIDSKQIAKKIFGFTSNSLAYMTKEFNEIYKKLDHAEFAGFKLWLECIRGNIKAWDEMKTYNIHDVLSLEELYIKMRPWIKDINFSIFFDINVCSCGSTDFVANGYRYMNSGAYQRLICRACGAQKARRENAIRKERRQILDKM